MKESLDIRKTSGVRDSDDFFQKEREWAFAYGKNIRDAYDCFNNLMYAQLRFTNQVRNTLLYDCTPYSLRPKLWTKFCFMKQNCQFQRDIV